jgi:hypothetical protein
VNSNAIALPDIAYYYPEPYWAERDIDWIKTVLLFFDGVAVLLPRLSPQHGPWQQRLDPVLGEPLLEAKLLHILEPEDIIDQEVADRFGSYLTELIANGAFDNLTDDDEFEWLSGSRMAASVDTELAEMLIDELHSRGLVREVTTPITAEADAGQRMDRFSVLMNSAVRRIVLTFWAQALRQPAARRGLGLQPITSQLQFADSFKNLLTSPRMPTEGDLINFDLQQVTLDLSIVPLQDVLDFRKQHGAEYRAYMRSLRQFMYNLRGLSGTEFRQAFQDRRDELADSAERLRHIASRHWRKNLAMFAISLIGAGLRLHAGDIRGAANSAGRAAGRLASPAFPDTAYSYLFQAEASLNR